MNGNYPLGAEYDSCAPWNERELPCVGRGVRVHFELVKEVEVMTDGYVSDGEGGVDVFVNSALEDFKGCLRSPLELIGVLGRIADAMLRGEVLPRGVVFWKKLACECNGWSLAFEDGWDA